MSLRKKVREISQRFEFHNGTQAERMATLQRDIHACILDGITQVVESMQERIDEIKVDLTYDAKEGQGE